MDLTFNEHETEFRDELRAWLAFNRPGDNPDGDGRDRYAWLRDWQRRLHEGGWAGVDWPVEYGGRGATLTQSAIFFEELARASAPLPVNVLGLLSMLACISADGGTVRLTAQASFIVWQDLREPTPSL